MFDSTKDLLIAVKAAPGIVAVAAARRVQAKFRADARTKRGNVPSFGKMGNVPIVAAARPEAIVVTAPDWCVAKADEKGQIAGWLDIVTEESDRAISAAIDGSGK